MSTFVYIVAEGVTDVTLLHRVLRRYFGMTQIKRKSELPDQARRWMSGFKWPLGDDIARLAVPAPVFMQRAEDGLLVGIRNAQGITRMNHTLELDHESFELIDWMPDALALFIDADGQEPAMRFKAYRDGLEAGSSLPSLSPLIHPAAAQTDDKGRRAGIFVFPGGTQTGTLDDLLLALGASAFPSLHQASAEFVASWHPDGSGGPLFAELRKPAGPVKARLSAMAALLKPGKNLNASLHDHPWVPEGEPSEALRTLVSFLRAILGEEEA